VLLNPVEALKKTNPFAIKLTFSSPNLLNTTLDFIIIQPSRHQID